MRRASASPKWMYCGGSIPLEAQHPSSDSPAAREGTAAHQMAECVLENFVGSPEELLDRAASNGVIMIEEMIDPVMMYVDHVRSHGVNYWIEESIAIPNTDIAICIIIFYSDTIHHF